MRENVVVFNIETTGVAWYEEFLQFAACDYDGNILINTYIKPDHRRTWVKAEKFNHITPAMVKDAPSFDDVAEKISNLLFHADTLIAYNMDFALNFMAEKAFYMTDGETRTVNVMNDFAEVYGEWDKYRHLYKCQKLETAAKYCGYSFNPGDSMNKVFATLHVYKSLRLIKQSRIVRDEESEKELLDSECERLDREFNSIV